MAYNSCNTQWEYASETGHTTKIIDNTMSILHYENKPLKINILEEIPILKKLKCMNMLNGIISSLPNPTFSI